MFDIHLFVYLFIYKYLFLSIPFFIDLTIVYTVTKAWLQLEMYP